MDDTRYLETQQSIWVIGILSQISNIIENYDITNEILNLGKLSKQLIINNIDYLKYNINDKVILRPAPIEYKNGIASTWELSKENTFDASIIGFLVMFFIIVFLRFIFVCRLCERMCSYCFCFVTIRI